MSLAIIAHRACPLHAPENSLAGIRKAGELGADGVQIDLRRTLDGVPVLMHDRSPWRTARLPGPVRLYPSFWLRRVRLRDSDERIPTLADALDALPEGLRLAIEAMDASASPSILALLREQRLGHRVLLSSYREQAIRYFVHEAPEMECVFARDATDPEGLRRFLEDATRFGARGIAPHWDAVSPQLVGEAHDRGLRVYSMSHDLGSVAKKVSHGLDGIVTDHPREVRAILEGTAS